LFERIPEAVFPLDHFEIDPQGAQGDETKGFGADFYQILLGRHSQVCPE
jgi:hypothetical protein